MEIAHIYRRKEDEAMFYCWFRAMHTRVDIAMRTGGVEDVCLELAERMRSRISEIEAAGNCFDPASELSRFNDGLLAPDELSGELQQILRICEEWRIRTDGIFNVKVNGRINLSGFLKGYALDELKPLLAVYGISDALVSMGNSSILAIGNRDAEVAGWLLTAPDGGTHLLRNQCLTTSGNDNPGRRHIIDPRTGKFIEGQRTVSVITDSGAEGEVMSIVKFILSA